MESMKRDEAGGRTTLELTLLSLYYIDAHKKTLMVINEDTRIIPGHGRPSNKAELQAYVNLLEDIKGKVMTAIKAGKSLEEVKADSSLTAAYDSTHGTGCIKPERLRQTFYTSLTSMQ